MLGYAYPMISSDTVSFSNDALTVLDDDSAELSGALMAAWD